MFFTYYRDRLRSSANCTAHTFGGAFTYYVCKKKIESYSEEKHGTDSIDESSVETNKLTDNNKDIALNSVEEGTLLKLSSI